MSEAANPEAERFARVLGGLSDAQAQLVTLLALDEPIFISTWCEIAADAGIREREGRALSTTSLRPVVLQLVGKGVVHGDQRGQYTIAAGMRMIVLRWAVTRGSFARLLQSSRRRYYDAFLEARLAVARGAANARALLETAVREQPHLAGDFAREATAHLDGAWLASLGPDVRASLMDLALREHEREPGGDLSLYRWLALDPKRLGGQPRAAAAMAGVAVELGDVDTLRALAAAPNLLELRPLIHVAHDLVEGRYAEASARAATLPDPKRGDHAGVLLALATIALRIDQPISERAVKWAAFGAKKGAPLQQTFRVLEAAIATAQTGRYEAAKLARDSLGDALYLLMEALRPVPNGSAVDSFGLFRMVMMLGNRASSYGTAGYRWLHEQYAHAAWALAEHLDPRARGDIEPAPSVPVMTVGPSLMEARTARQAWELQLDRLELLAQAATPGSESESAGERVIWRIRGRRYEIEPYLQKRTAGGKWSAGRKLGIKHLIGKTDVTARLPPEDLRVAQYAREHRQTNYGYPSISHAMMPGAWIALVGHPRVYFEDEEVPCQVSNAEPRVTVRSERGAAVVTLEPPGLEPGINVRFDAGHFWVYDVKDSMKGLTATLGAALTVPPAGKDRLMAILERLTRLVPIESTERSGAKQVAPDPTPVMRLTPSRGGLATAMLVRPLGPGTAAVLPGVGATTLLGRSGGEPVQTERDLDAEVARAESLLADLAPILGGTETGDFTWHVPDPEDCLELVATLRDHGESVRVEWPHGKPLRVRSRLGRKALRGRLSSGGGAFSLDASLAVDGELSLELEQLLELLAQHPGRFVQLASGEYVELEQELREVLDGIAVARTAAGAQRGKVELPRSAIAVLDQLTREGTGLKLDDRAADWRGRFAEVFRSEPRVPKSFQGELRDYQLDGFRWLTRIADLGLGACLADDMGLGKTVQLVALLLQRASLGPALVVAPTSVCENWRREIERFAPSLSVRAFWGSDRDGTLRDLGRRDVVVTSYTLLQQNAEAFHAIEWTTGVLDEAQLIKNADTLRAKAAFGLKAAARVVATGTPVENHAGDLFSLFHFLNPGLLGSFKTFSARLAAGGSAARAHKRLITPFVLRRTKAQVLDDLPPMTEIQRTVLLTPGEAKLYDAIRRAALDKLKTAGSGGQARIQVLAELTRLRRLCCHPALVAPAAGLTSSKLESFLELTEELVAGRHRVLVFSQFTDVLALVRPLLEAKGIAYQYLDGATPPKQRAAAVDAFQNGEGDVFLISLKAGGFGLNLTAADYVVHLDPWWNPAVESQASDRAHRIGQTRPVTVYRLVAKGTIEERIVELHREKRDLADAVLAETDRAAKLSAEEMMGLLEMGPG